MEEVRGGRKEMSVHVVGVGVGVRLVDSDEDEESRADRRHYSPLDLRSLTPSEVRRSIQGRFRTKCNRAVLWRGSSPRHWPRGRAALQPSSWILYCVRHAWGTTGRVAARRWETKKRRRLWWGCGMQYVNADVSLIGPWIAPMILLGRERI